jgi:hypothetical protein
MSIKSKIADETPDGNPIPFTATIIVEKATDGFWSYYEGRRSPGVCSDVPLNEFLAWLIEQIYLGHSLMEFEDDKVVNVSIGKRAAHRVPSSDAAAKMSNDQIMNIAIAVAVAEAWEKGYSPDNGDKLKGILEKLKSPGVGALRFIEVHYALILCELLGRISKKLPKLEQLPIVGFAPETVRSCLAEATRCYLLKMERACIALCRASLELTLKDHLTAQTRADWDVEKAKRGEMNALIEVCARHKILDVTHVKDAHFIRERANEMLHTGHAGGNLASAFEVLRRTRTIAGVLYGKATKG